MCTLGEMYITKVMLLDSFSANIETLNAFFSFWLVYAHTYGLKKGKRKEFHFELQVNNLEKVPFV